MGRAQQMEGGGGEARASFPLLPSPLLHFFCAPPIFVRSKSENASSKPVDVESPTETLATQATVFFTKGVVFWDYSGIEIHRTIEGNR